MTGKIQRFCKNMKKRVMEEAEQRTVEYYEEFFRNNGHDVKLAK